MKIKYKVNFLGLIIFFGIFLLAPKAFATYETSGNFTSTNLLNGQTVGSITSFVYNLSAKPSGTNAAIQFSQNNTNWYSSAGTAGGNDTLTTGSNNTIDLSGLHWSGANFYYKVSFTSDGNDTPVLDDVTVYYNDAIAPTVTLSAAGDVAARTAVIKGNVTATGGENPTVTMYWGTTDGGTNPANWQNSSAPSSPSTQPQDAAAFYKNLTGLTPNTTYYFSAKAANSAGTDWPAASLEFTTGNTIVSTPYAWTANTTGNNVSKVDTSSGNVVGTYSVGTGPRGTAIDAAGNIWVSNSGSDNVMKLDQSGNILGTFNVGDAPNFLAIDASGNVWVTNGNTDNVTKLDSSGTVLGTFAAGDNPYGIATDASGNVWVANFGSSTVSKLDSAGNLLQTYDVGANPNGVSIDSQGNAWVTNWGERSVSKITPSGTNTKYPTPGNSGIRSLTFNEAGNTVMVQDLGYIVVCNSSGIQQGSMYDIADHSFGISLDANGNIWVTENYSDKIIKVSSSFNVIGSYDVGDNPLSLGDFTGYALQRFVLGYSLPDTTNPTVQTLTPVDNATNVAVDSNLVIDFSENVDVETGNIVIKKTSDNSTVETIGVTSGQVTGTGTDTITINPTNNFEEKTNYYVQIDATAFDDSAGNSYVGISNATSWSFTIGDFTNPAVQTLAPADNATDVTVGANLIIQFSETIDVETGNISIKKSADNSTVETFSLPSANVTGTGTNAITINPTNNLSESTGYYVQINATAFDDTAGNSYAGIADATTWNFTTGDFTNPTVSSLIPADNATNIAVNANLVIDFSENVDVETGNIVIKKTSDNSTVETFVLPSAKVTGTGTDIITINPTNNFEEKTGYYVQVDATAFDDAAGNSYVGISNTTTWNFTTADNTNPAISTLTPADDAVNVSLTDNLVIKFSEPVVVGTGNIIIKKANDTILETISVTGAKVTGSGTDTITINPTANFQNNNGYNISIDGTAFDDLAGNGYAGISDSTTWNFSTPLTSPATSLSIMDIGADYAVVLINLNLDGASNANSFFYWGTTDHPSSDTGWDNYANMGMLSSSVISHNFYHLSPGTTYYFTCKFVNAGGTAWPSSSISFTTTENTAPIVSALTPADNATGVAIDANLVIDFSENVDVETGNIVIKKTSDNSTVETFVLPSAKVTGTGTDIITINPTNNFEEKTGYYVQVDATAFDDAAGNSYVGISNTTTWNFTTADNTNPAISTLTPADDATDAPISGAFSIAFAETVYAGTGNIAIKKSSDDSTVETIVVNNDVVSVVGSDDIYINHTDLESFTQYYVLIDSGAFVDGAGNSFAGISDATTWNFTTGDGDAPQIETLTPADNSTGVAIDANLIVKFNEPIEAGEEGQVAIVDVANYDGEEAGLELINIIDNNISGDTLTINPPNNLEPSKQYAVELSKGAVKDFSGNDFPGTSVEFTDWNFTTAAADDDDNTPINNGPTAGKFIEDIASGFITVEGGNPAATEKLTFTTDYTIVDGSSRVTIPNGTEMTKVGGGIMDITETNLENITDAIRSAYVGNIAGAVSVGIPNLKLYFSQNITVLIPVGSSYDGQTLNVYYLNNGENTWNSGITCTVSGGECVFLTNHATTYSAGDLPSLAENILEPGPADPFPPVVEEDREDSVEVDDIHFSSDEKSITVTWKTNTNADSKVKYGTDKDDLKLKETSKKKVRKHKITIKDLDSDTEYFFKVYSVKRDNDDSSRIYTARTLPVVQSGNDNVALPSDYAGDAKPNACSYVIEGGDNLWTIAKKIYGDATAYPLIIKQNKDRYPDIETKLKIGQELKFDCQDGEGVNAENLEKVSETGNQRIADFELRWWNPLSWF